MRARPLMLAALAAILALLASAGAALAGPIPLTELWPNDDGHTWTYEARTEARWPDSIDTDRVLRMQLVGTAVVPGGQTVQLLRGVVVAGPVSMAQSEIADPFLRTLHLARPDLRAAIEARAGDPGCMLMASPGFDGILLSPETAFRKTDDEIAGWRCDLADTRAWLFLVADLTPGSTFTLQLIPDLASDVFLHGTIGPVEDVSVPAGVFGNCQRVDYVVDYGLASCTDDEGNPQGTFRSETRGWIHYAPGVGPVDTSEEFIPYAEASGACGSDWAVGVAAVRVSKQLASIPNAAHAASWGGLKRRYR